jgi:uncharacterized protein
MKENLIYKKYSDFFIITDKGEIKMPPVSLLIKPASGSCNIRCKYCFYIDEMSNRNTALYGKMTDEILETMVKKGMEYADDSITFGFQGGEPTLMGLEFFEKFCRLKEKYNTKHLRVNCSIQTNGTLLNKEWARFFAKEKFLVGVSLDGPRSIHDKYRLSLDGGGTFQRVMRSARLLTQAEVDFNILTVLTEDSARDIERIYKFLVSKKFLYQQYIPCLDPLQKKNQGQNYSLTAETFGIALKKLFDLWFADVTAGIPVYNRYFDDLVKILAGYEPESCDMRGQCSIQYVVEADGGMYPCDFYVLDEYKIGNIMENSFDEIDIKRKEIQFIEKSIPMHSDCMECKWKNICRGGCRRNRERYQEKQLGLNRFCDAYKMFFPYAIERLMYLAASTKH